MRVRVRVRVGVRVRVRALDAHEHGENELGARAVRVGRLAQLQCTHLWPA